MASDSEVGLKDLPDELLLHILSNDSLGHQDLVTVGSCCSRLRDVAATQKLWRLKIQQHWPSSVIEQYPKEANIRDWHGEVVLLVSMVRKVKTFVNGLSARLYNHLHITTPVYAEIDQLVNSTPYAFIYILCALRQILEDGDEKYTNLTEKYYALRVMSHVYQGMCQREWQEFMDLSDSEQTLERGAILFARWFQPQLDVSSKQVSSNLDNIALEVLKCLRLNHADHPALQSPLVSIAQPISQTIWNHNQAVQLFKCLNNVLFTQMKFCGNSSDYYNIKNSLINEVLEQHKGIPITLCIIYQTLCHRLGILLEPVNYPSHFIMRWKPPGSTEYEYIDAFNKGRRLSADELLKELPFAALLGHRNNQHFLNATDNKMMVFQRMIRNIMKVSQEHAHISDHMELFCSATELMSLASPNEQSIQELLLRIYYSLEIHYDRIVAGCQKLLEQRPSNILEEMLEDSQKIMDRQQNEPKPIKSKVRAGLTLKVKFATGLIMKHKRYDYTCVIFGWDVRCKMPEDWVQRMGVDNLQFKTEQPFYNVLVCDGSHRYAAQESLDILSEPVPVTHRDVGKYFCEWLGSHYGANDEVTQAYPDDEPVKMELLRKNGLLL